MQRRNVRKVRQEEEGSPLEMTSMIDVVFLLLIFFMCTTKFKLPEGSLRSHLPRNRGSSNPDPTVTKGCRITLLNDAGKVRCFADEVMVSDSMEYSMFEEARGMPVGPSMVQIEDHIRARKENYAGLGDKGLPVIMDFAEDVPYKYVSDVLNICHRLGVLDLAFAAPEIPYGD